jgi:alcohol dehydrogenase class IV
MGLRALGYAEADLAALTRGAVVQRRLVDNAPLRVDDEHMRALLAASL